MTTKRGHTAEQVETFARRVARHKVLEFLSYSKWEPISFSVLPVRVDPDHVNQIKRGKSLIAEFKWSEIPPKVRPLVGLLTARLMEEACMAELALKVADFELRTNAMRRTRASEGAAERKRRAKKENAKLVDAAEKRLAINPHLSLARVSEHLAAHQEGQKLKPDTIRKRLERQGVGKK